MQSKKHIRWLEEQNLLQLAKKNYIHYKRVLRECTSINKGEVLIISDHGYEGRNIAALMSFGYYLATTELGLKTNFLIQEPKYRGDDADEHVIEALDNLTEGSFIILNLSGRLGHLKWLGDSYRKFIKSRNHKFISAPSLGEIETNNYQAVLDSINIDYQKLNKKCNEIKDILDSGTEIHVTTSKGTDFYYNVKGMKAIANSGIIEEGKHGGNIPSGETYIPPRGKNKVYGKVVIDATLSYKHGSWLLKNPVTLTAEQGKVVDIEGDEGALLLENTLSWAEQKAKHPWGIRRIGEFGIGLNKGAKVIGATLVDEKAYNTSHVAIGSNSWFGGEIYAIIHLDQVFRNPTVYVDDEKLNI